jgi:hypothetical protein
MHNFQCTVQKNLDVPTRCDKIRTVAIQEIIPPSFELAQGLPPFSTPLFHIPISGNSVDDEPSPCRRPCSAPSVASATASRPSTNVPVAAPAPVLYLASRNTKLEPTATAKETPPPSFLSIASRPTQGLITITTSLPPLSALVSSPRRTSSKSVGC